MIPGFLFRFSRDESGATAIEYGLIGGLIGLVVVGFMQALSAPDGGLFNATRDRILAAIGG